MTLQPRTRNVLAWMLWLATMASCLAGLVVALLVARPLTAQVDLDALEAELLAVADRPCSPPAPPCGCARRPPAKRSGSAADAARA